MKLKELGLKRKDGVITGFPYYGVKVAIVKRTSDLHPDHYIAHIEISDIVEFNGGVNLCGIHTVRRFKLYEVLGYIDALGDREVLTSNMLNRSAGKFPIALRDKGGCCDPDTETYHTM